MKKFLKKIWDGVKNIYHKLIGGTQKYVPIAINIVEAVKSVMATPVDDILAEIIKKSIPGGADDVLIDNIKNTVEKYIPLILIELQATEIISNIEDPKEQLKAIFDRIKVSSNETQNILWHGLASLLIEKLSDGRISWSDAVALSEYYFTNLYKPINK
jgi:hypothetical protein